MVYLHSANSVPKILYSRQIGLALYIVPSALEFNLNFCYVIFLLDTCNFILS